MYSGKATVPLINSKDFKGINKKREEPVMTPDEFAQLIFQARASKKQEKGIVINSTEK